MTLNPNAKFISVAVSHVPEIAPAVNDLLSDVNDLASLERQVPRIIEKLQSASPEASDASPEAADLRTRVAECIASIKSDESLVSIHDRLPQETATNNGGSTAGKKRSAEEEVPTAQPQSKKPKTAPAEPGAIARLVGVLDKQPQPNPGDLPAVNIEPPKANEVYKDWSRTCAFTPRKVHAPKTVDELFEILSNAEGPVSVIASWTFVFWKLVQRDCDYAQRYEKGEQ